MEDDVIRTTAMIKLAVVDLSIIINLSHATPNQPRPQVCFVAAAMSVELGEIE